MKEYSKDEIKAIFSARREKLFSYMAQNGITAAVFEDTEGRRTPAVRYFTGHPSDAIFIATSDGKCVLVPWDENLAEQRAVDVKILPYTKFERRNLKARM